MATARLGLKPSSLVPACDSMHGAMKCSPIADRTARFKAKDGHGKLLLVSALESGGQMRQELETVRAM